MAPVFGYATPVNSQGEVSCDTGLFGRNGSRGTQLSTDAACGYGLMPHLTFTAFVPAPFGSPSLPESRIFPTGEWSAGGDKLEASLLFQIWLDQPKARHRNIPSPFGHPAPLLHATTLRRIILKLYDNNSESDSRDGAFVIVALKL